MGGPVGGATEARDAGGLDRAAVVALARGKALMQFRRRADALGVPEVAGASPTLTALFKALLSAEGSPSHEALGAALAIHPTLLGDLARGEAGIPRDVDPDALVRLARASGLGADDFDRLLQRDWAQTPLPESLPPDAARHLFDRYRDAWRYYEESDRLSDE